MDGFALVHWWVPRERQELVANALRTLADNPATPVGNLAGAVYIEEQFRELARRHRPGHGGLMTRRASIWFCLAVQAFFTFTFPSEAHPALPTVITAPCPTRPDALGCADLDDDLLYVLPGLRMPGRRLVIAHERGHFFDLWHPGVRAITGLGPERFADAYARCRYRGEAWRGAGFGRVLLGVCEVVTWPA